MKLQHQYGSNQWQSFLLIYILFDFISIQGFFSSQISQASTYSSLLLMLSLLLMPRCLPCMLLQLADILFMLQTFPSMERPLMPLLPSLMHVMSPSNVLSCPLSLSALFYACSLPRPLIVYVPPFSHPQCRPLCSPCILFVLPSLFYAPWISSWDVRWWGDLVKMLDGEDLVPCNPLNFSTLSLPRMNFTQLAFEPRSIQNSHKALWRGWQMPLERLPTKLPILMKLSCSMIKTLSEQKWLSWKGPKPEGNYFRLTLNPFL